MGKSTCHTIPDDKSLISRTHTKSDGVAQMTKNQKDIWRKIKRQNFKHLGNLCFTMK